VIVTFWFPAAGVISPLSVIVPPKKTVRRS